MPNTLINNICRIDSADLRVASDLLFNAPCCFSAAGMRLRSFSSVRSFSSMMIARFVGNDLSVEVMVVRSHWCEGIRIDAFRNAGDLGDCKGPALLITRSAAERYSCLLSAYSRIFMFPPGATSFSCRES
jgi:hypothetical protein